MGRKELLGSEAKFNAVDFLKNKSNVFVVWQFVFFAALVAVVPLAAFFTLELVNPPVASGGSGYYSGIISIGLCVVICLAYAMVAYYEEVRDFKLRNDEKSASENDEMTVTSTKMKAS